MDQNQRLLLLGRVGLFSMLDDRMKRSVAKRLDELAVPFGETVFQAGDPSDALYIVVAGKARVVGLTATGKETSLAVLRDGDIFGEGGLLTDSARTATIRAADDLHLLRFNRTDFRRLLTEYPVIGSAIDRYTSDHSVQNFLHQYTALESLPPHVLRNLLTELEELHVNAGRRVVQEGDVGERLYIVRRGALDALKHDGEAEQLVGQIGEGEFFGELALFSGTPRAVSVVARTDCDLYAISKPGFDRALASSPAFRARLEQRAAMYRAAGDAEVQVETTYETPDGEKEEEPAIRGPRWRRWLRRYPFIRQRDETDCGAASLGMVTAYYGAPVGVARLRDLANVDADGASMWSVAQAAETLGFHARGLQLSFDALRDLTLPAIVHWEGYHYIVLYEVQRKTVVVGDPGLSLKRISVEEFRRGWTGRALELIPTAKLGKTERISSPYRRFWPIVRPHLPMLGELLGASLVLSVLGLGIPLFTQMVIDRVLVNRTVELLNMMLVGILVVALFQAVISVVRRLLVVHVSTRANARLVSDFLRHVMNLPMRFFDLRRTGDIISRVSENDTIQEAMVSTIPGIIIDTVLALGYVALMAYYNVKLTVVVLLVMPFYVGLMVAFTPAIRRNRAEHFARYADAWSYLIESVNGVATVKAMAVEQRVRSRLDTLFVDSFIVAKKGAHIETAYSGLAAFVQTVAAALFLWYGALQVMENAMTVGQLLAFVALAANITTPLLRMVEAWDTLQDLRNAFDRLNDVFDARPEEPENRELLNLTHLEGRITFDDVSFRYTRSQDRPTLAGVSFAIEPGQRIALVGRSGSGKTTVSKLILGLYLPTTGRVQVDGHDIRILARRTLRRRIGVVPQEIFLFSGTIRENIALADPDSPFDQVIRAAKAAGAHEFITGMGMGYETKIGERGMTMSGGQRQRIALARALLHEPDILLLDEATASLDTESERAIQRSLDEASHNRTTIVIAHRLSTVRDADRILVLDAGAVVEHGTHDELLARSGLYAALVGQQVTQ